LFERHEKGEEEGGMAFSLTFDFVKKRKERRPKRNSFIAE